MFVAALAAACFFSIPSHGATITCALPECVAMALRNNDQLKAADADLQLSLGRVTEAHPRGIPIIKYEYRLAPVPANIDDPLASFFGGDLSVFNSIKIELASPITTFGKIKTAQELAQLGVDASWFKKQKTVDDLVFKIHQIYYGILLARELLSLADQAVSALKEKISDLERVRVIDQLQILKLKTARYEVTRKIEEAIKKEKLALEALKVQMGLPETAAVDIKDRSLSVIPFKLEKIDRYVDQIPSSHPDYALLTLGLVAKQKQLRLEKKQRLPNIGLGGFYDTGYAPNISGAEDETDFSNPFNYRKFGVGFQMKGEYDYVRSKAKVRQATADLLKITHERRAAIDGLTLDAKKSYFDVEEASRLMIQVGDEKKLARQMVFLTKSNLDIGLGEKKDYLDALQSYLLFQGREYEAIYNYNVAVSELKKKTGTLYMRNNTR